jgi:ABC-type glycerol-3-phosphate transport system substrate-binding protein
MICVSMITGLLTGCRTGAGSQPVSGAESQKNTGIKGTAAASQTAQNGEHEAITMSCHNNMISKAFVEKLHEVYPEIHLEIVPYSGMNGSGYAKYSLINDDMTDIFTSTKFYLPELQPERLVNLASYDFVNQYSTFMLNSVDVDGGIYLLPSGYSISGINYNKTLMEENGWEVPTSFEELKELVPKIEAAGYKPFANRMDLLGFPFMYFFGVGNTEWFYTQEGSRWKEDFAAGRATAQGQEGLLRAAKAFQKWVDEGYITTEHTDNSTYMENCDTVFMLNIGMDSFEYTADDGKVYKFGTMPWLSEDGSSNMLVRDVGRYFGINKHLEEPGNEQKLADALHVMEFFSSPEGQSALTQGNSLYVSPLNGDSIGEDSPYYDTIDLINSGNVIQQVYVDWEDLIIPISEDIKKMIEGKLTPEQLVAAFDQDYQDVQNAADMYGTVTEDLTIDESQRLVAIAEGRAVDADAVLYSLPAYHGDGFYNTNASGWHLYQGGVNMYMINMIRTPSPTICVLELTGAQIKALQEGGFKCDASEPYEYRLLTKGDIKLDDQTTYRLAVGSKELTPEMAAKAEDSGQAVDEAIAAYVTELGTFGASDIRWE